MLTSTNRDGSDLIEAVLDDPFQVLLAQQFKARGEAVAEMKADGVEYPAEGVFILRDSIRPASLLPGLETDGAHIRTDARMKCSIPGVFAAGDGTGRPYQIARAVGQGNLAALSAADYLKERK